MKQRYGVLGLDTAKQVMITFLILVVVGIAIILALTSLQSATTTSIDTSTIVGTVTNESIESTGNLAYINQTGYTLDGYNSSWSGITFTAAWNISASENFNVTVLTPNISVSSGVVYNTSTLNYNNASLSYYYTYTYNNGRTGAITGNVSSGLVTFFSSVGTIFSILIVVVIILAISIIIWAVGRFGNQAQNESVNL